jgi:hypothetical protein
MAQQGSSYTTGGDSSLQDRGLIGAGRFGAVHKVSFPLPYVR